MKLRTLKNLGALMVFALLTLRGARTEAGDPSTARGASAKKIQAPTSGHPDKTAKTNKSAAPEATGDAGAATDLPGDAAVGVGPVPDSATKHSDEAAAEHSPPPPTIVAVPPQSVSRARPHEAQKQSQKGLLFVDRLPDSLLLSAGVLLLSLLTAAAAALALYALRRGIALRKHLAHELQITHTRLEQLGQRLIELERLAPALPGPVLPDGPGVELPAPKRLKPLTAARITSIRLGSQKQLELPLLQQLITALDLHGVDTASGTHIEVDLQDIEVPAGSTPGSKDLAAQLSQLNFVAATLPEKSLKQQNFLSIVSKRSRADNIPRRMVRVHKEALPALRELAFGHS